MFCYASPHNNTASTKWSALNNVSVCITFSYAPVNSDRPSLLSKWKRDSSLNRILAQSCLLNLKWRLHHVSLAARYLGSKLGQIAGRRGLMWRSRSLLRTVLELIGRNPRMLLAVRHWRLESISQMHHLVILLAWRHMWTTWTLTVPSVFKLSKTPQQWLYSVAMNIKMSSDNVLCQSSLEHTKSTKTLIFGETWHNTEINVIQVKVIFFWFVGVKTNLL
jgi:hypothetical protein